MSLSRRFIIFNYKTVLNIIIHANQINGVKDLHITTVTVRHVAWSIFSADRHAR